MLAISEILGILSFGKVIAASVKMATGNKVIASNKGNWNQPTKLEILDGTTPLARYAIASIQSVNVDLAGFDDVIVDDSNGQPFAENILVSLSGSGNNSLELISSQTIQRETYFGNSSQEAFVVVGPIAVGSAHGYTVAFSSAVGSVGRLAQDRCHTLSAVVCHAGHLERR